MSLGWMVKLWISSSQAFLWERAGAGVCKELV